MRPLPGISAAIVDGDAKEVPADEQGFLVLTEPWPAMLRGIWGDMERYRDTYWSRFAEEGYYFAGDGAKLDSDGALWVLGRVDDVMNISGHRISTSEVESALVGHRAVAEAAVVGANDETTGQAIVAYVILRGNVDAEEDRQKLIDELRAEVSREISPIAKPRDITIVPELPRPVPARSCVDCSRTWPRAARAATPRPWRIRRSWTRSARRARADDRVAGEGRHVTWHDG